MPNPYPYKIGEDREVSPTSQVTPKTGTTLELSNNVTGLTYNYGAASSNSNQFYVAANKSVNGFARNFIQYTQAELDLLTNGYPFIIGAKHLTSRSDVLTADQKFEMVVDSPDGVAVNYWFQVYY